MFRRNRPEAEEAPRRSFGEWLLDLLVGPVRPPDAPRRVAVDGRWPSRSEWAQTQTRAEAAAMWSVDDHSDLQLQTDLPWDGALGLPPARPLLRSEAGG